MVTARSRFQHSTEQALLSRIEAFIAQLLVFIDVGWPDLPWFKLKVFMVAAVGGELGDFMPASILEHRSSCCFRLLSLHAICIASFKAAKSTLLISMLASRSIVIVAHQVISTCTNMSPSLAGSSVLIKPARRCQSDFGRQQCRHSGSLFPSEQQFRVTIMRRLTAKQGFESPRERQ